MRNQKERKKYNVSIEERIYRSDGRNGRYEDEKVRFTGFGRFEMKTLESRKGRLPLGGECFIPEHKKIKFYPSRSLSKKMEEMQEEE